MADPKASELVSAVKDAFSIVSEALPGVEYDVQAAALGVVLGKLLEGSYEFDIPRKLLAGDILKNRKQL